MKKDPLVFLSHIIESIEHVQDYSEGITQPMFLKDPILQDAMIRRLEVIGEAVKGLPNSFKNKYPEVPWKQMAGMRDILIHKYFNVDLVLTWKVVKHNLPKVMKQLLSILNDMAD